MRCLCKGLEWGGAWHADGKTRAWVGLLVSGAGACTQALRLWTYARPPTPYARFPGPGWAWERASYVQCHDPGAAGLPPDKRLEQRGSNRSAQTWVMWSLPLAGLALAKRKSAVHFEQRQRSTHCPDRHDCHAQAEHPTLQRHYSADEEAQEGPQPRCQRCQTGGQQGGPLWQEGAEGACQQRAGRRTAGRHGPCHRSLLRCDHGQPDYDAHHHRRPRRQGYD